MPGTGTPGELLLGEYDTLSPAPAQLVVVGNVRRRRAPGQTKFELPDVIAGTAFPLGVQMRLQTGQARATGGANAPTAAIASCSIAAGLAAAAGVQNLTDDEFATVFLEAV